ncbi:MAG: adenylate/guanylate cyclase domain-containing protein [Burkholderiales bacterium PBB6]|nr:MAG: adenylate/guanylate cyclase domain-containing protein [Burkholderiales bacterium PBB6]
MATIKRRYVLFADLRGSTALYEHLGNAQATTVVTQVIRTLARWVPSSGGQLVKTLGDGLMAVFPSALTAVSGAAQMQEELDRQSVANADSGNDTRRMHLQIAITAGEVVEVGGDCFGDAVNVAARLLDHAGDGESLISRNVFDELPWEIQSRFRHLDKVRLRGRIETVEVFLLTPKGADTAATELESRVDAIEPAGLQLVWQDRAFQWERHRLPVIIGRNVTAAMRVDDPRVSRTHARIDMTGGALQVTDLSINGTFVRFAGDDEILSLRRGACTLHGSGDLGLGGSPNDPRVATLHFDVLAGSDTRPMRLLGAGDLIAR